MGFLIAGIIVLILASLLHSYCSIGIKMLNSLRPMVFDTNPILLQLGWILFFIIGIILLFLYNWIIGIIGIIVYWFLLPLIVTPIVRRRMLPSWEELPDFLKDKLSGEGYDKENYLNGDWWKLP